MAKITESRPPVLGQQHSYSILPKPSPGCRVTYVIDGRTVNLRDQVGGLRVVGFTADGGMTVETVGNTTYTIIEARIECPEMPTIVAGPIGVGSGSYDSCEQEPCKGSREIYVRAALDGLEAAQEVTVQCRLYKFFSFLVLVVFLFFVALLALFIACRALPLMAALCTAIDAALVALAAGIAAATAKLVLIRRAIYRLERLCAVHATVMAGTYLRMQRDCPRDCWAPEVKIDCVCR